MIRIATTADIDEVMEILKATVKFMHGYGNDQWDELYPSREDVLCDINRGELFVGVRGSVIAGFICLNNNEPLEYQNLQWSKSSSAVVVHRMAVSQKFMRQGVASELMNYADVLAAQQNNYLKTDTYSLNVYAQGLFAKFGYTRIGTMNYRGKQLKFFCYEKILKK